MDCAPVARIANKITAYGLLQVTKQTVRELYRVYPELVNAPALKGVFDAKTGAVDETKLRDARIGAIVGTAALKMYMDRYNGDARKALIAYNWGPDNLRSVEEGKATVPAMTERHINNIEHVLKQRQGLTLPKASTLYYLTPEEREKYKKKAIEKGAKPKQ